MDATRILDFFPLWGLSLATVAVVALAVEIGYRIGKLRRQQAHAEKDTPVSTIVGSTLGLLGFILAFTFGMAASRFDGRKEIVLEEANAIGTTYLRAALLPATQGTEIRKLLRNYVDQRLLATQPGDVETALRTSEELHHALWSQVTIVAAADQRSVITGLFVQSLNEMIDLHSKRVLYGLHNRIPESIWLALYFITILSMSSLGYQEGLAGSRRSLTVFALILTFSAVILLIADLDRPYEGQLRVSQQSMESLREQMRADS